MEDKDAFWELRGRLTVIEAALSLAVRAMAPDTKALVRELLNALSSKADELNGLEPGATDEESRLHAIEKAARSLGRQIDGNYKPAQEPT